MHVSPHQSVSWLGGMTPAQFMRRHWQKKPLLVRNAFPGFSPPISIAEILSLCQHPDAQSRLIRRKPRQWELKHGPFAAREIPSVKTPDWTVLVQQVNTLLSSADRFLDAFRFIPEARLDDLMVSVAGPNGGIGAHVDSYDVFLVQAAGERRWEIAEEFDPSLQTGEPLKILRRFKAEQSWVLGPGDLLYLPPNVAHRGTAVGPGCMTWSVGFRAPNQVTLADAAWSQHLDRIESTDWADPWLSATDTPGKIPQRLLKTMARQVRLSLPGPREIEKAVACVLSEPAPSAVFHGPQRPDSLARFQAQTHGRGLRLAPPSRLLYYGGQFFMNGELVSVAAETAETRILQRLADRRCLPAQRIPHAACAVLYEMYRAGWIVYD